MEGGEILSEIILEMLKKNFVFFILNCENFIKMEGEIRYAPPTGSESNKKKNI